MLTKEEFEAKFNEEVGKAVNTPGMIPAFFARAVALIVFAFSYLRIPADGMTGFNKETGEFVPLNEDYYANTFRIRAENFERDFAQMLIRPLVPVTSAPQSEPVRNEQAEPGKAATDGRQAADVAGGNPPAVATYDDRPPVDPPLPNPADRGHGWENHGEQPEPLPPVT